MVALRAAAVRRFHCGPEPFQTQLPALLLEQRGIKLIIKEVKSKAKFYSILVVEIKRNIFMASKQAPMQS